VSLWRAHDTVLAVGRWTQLRASLTDAGAVAGRLRALTVEEEADLLALLARLPERDDLASLYADSAVPSTRPPAEDLLDLRDVAYELAEIIRPPGNLHPLLRFGAGLQALVDGDARASLDVWLARVATRRGEYEQLRSLRERGATVRPHGEPSVIVRIEPGSSDPSRYLLTIWVYHGAERSIKVYCDDSGGHDLVAVRDILQRELKRVLRQLYGRGIVEFVIPMDLFDERFEDLTLGRTFASLGRTNPVVLRDLERHREPETWHSWLSRWGRLVDGTARTTWVGCDPAVEPEHLDGWLRRDPDIAVLALSRGSDRPALDALEVAIYAGLPAAVWRREVCTHNGPGGAGPCPGDLFRAGFTRRRDEQAAVLLPELVRRLRSAAATDDHDECRDIVLLWDDPNRMPEPDMPLLQPY
jgi:hypothetical protein